MSVLKVDTLVPVNTALRNWYLGKAWCKFSMDPVSTGIISSGNVSSLTDTAVGRPTLNLATAMVNADAAMSNSPALYSGGQQFPLQSGGRVVSSITVDVYCGSDSVALKDWDEGSVMVVRS